MKNLSKILCLMLSYNLNCWDLSHNNNIKNNTLNIDLKLDQNEILHSKTWKVDSQNPYVNFQKIETVGSSQIYTNPNTNKSEEIYKDKVSFKYIINNQHEIKQTDTDALVSFKINKDYSQKVINLSLSDNQKSNLDVSNQVDKNVSNGHDSSSSPKDKSSSNSSIQECIIKFTKYWRDTLTSLFKTTGSSWVRYLVTFIIGVLLSLTPCIYPMIPITVGILQATGSNSFIKNLLISLSYTLGISLTFAVFGFITALGSCAFGQLQTSPWFIIPLVIILTYLGLSMFGLYDMHVPKFLRAKTANVKKGSALGAFVFGAISGTVASPCLSPGLALVLSYVIEINKIGNITGYLEGFSLLFIFGVGSSLPLLIVGTFSNSLKVLPKAGLWMVEVKKLLGLMLLGMCFYYLKAILPLYILLWILSTSLFAVGIYYFWTVQSYDSKYIKYYKNLVGLVFIILSFIVAINAFKSTYDYIYGKKATKVTEKITWYKDLEKAKELAKKENKFLFIDFYGELCSACTELEENVLSKNIIEEILSNYYIPLKVNTSDRNNNAFNNLKEYIKIIGVPTIVIFNSENNKVVKEWVGANISVEELKKELEQNHK